MSVVRKNCEINPIDVANSFVFSGFAAKLSIVILQLRKRWKIFSIKKASKTLVANEILETNTAIVKSFPLSMQQI